MMSNATAGCNYFSVFENGAHADHEYAANCVPATTCKENVVGMTQGMIALYGVVMQILQQNLGSLAWIGEGDMASCYAGMNKANMGSLDDIIAHKPIKIGPIPSRNRESSGVRGHEEARCNGDLVQMQ